MAPPRRPWFRFYVEAIHDRKLRRRPPGDRWLWVVLLAVARESEEPGALMIGSGPASIEDLADLAALKPKDVAAAMAYFTLEGMLTDDGSRLVVTKFRDRQFEGDHSTDRVVKHRSKDDDETTIGRYINVDTPPDVTAMKRRSSRARVTDTENREQKELEPRVKSLSEGRSASPPDPDQPNGFVGFYVDECRARGYQPVAQWRAQIGNQSKRIATEKSPDLIRSAIRIMADERKAPGILAHVIADIEAGRNGNGQSA